MQKYQSEKYNSFYMDLACVAASNAVTTGKQVGACIVLPNGVMALGWNGTVSGADNNCKDCDGVTKPDVIHAEINALKKLQIAGLSTVGAKIFCTFAPCLSCAVSLSDIGITEFIYINDYKCPKGIELLKSTKVRVRKY